MIFQKKKILEWIVILSIMLFLIGFLKTLFYESLQNAKMASCSKTLYEIYLAMQNYALDDIDSHKLPYPLPKGYEKLWGEDATCWSPAVAKLLLMNKKSNKDVVKMFNAYPNGRPENYQPMFIHFDSNVDKNMANVKMIPLDFHLYCHKDLTLASNDRTIIAITYDNDDLQNCLFGGEGWIVLYLGGATSYYHRKLPMYDHQESKKIISLDDFSVRQEFIANKNESLITLRKNMRPRQAWGKGGGSTELIGAKDSDEIIKVFTE